MLATVNRIREIRKHQGLSSDALAKLVHTSGANVRRYETGDQELTLEWLHRFAQALRVHPNDLLLEVGPQIEWRNEVEPTNAGYPEAIQLALSHKKIGIYKVLADSVADCGILPDETITVDEGQEAITAAQTGDIVLVSMESRSRPEKMLALRVFVGPALLTTNRRGHNVAIRLDDASVSIALMGVVIRSTLMKFVPSAPMKFAHSAPLKPASMPRGYGEERDN
jgi:transcriptional regulator with XRE-family HTH domain